MSGASSQRVKLKYVGSGGEFLHGIPARDLTEDDWNRLTKEQQGIVGVSRLYKEVVKIKKQEESNGG